MFTIVGIGFFLAMCVSFGCLLLFSSGLLLECGGVTMKGVFVFDGLSFYTILLIVFLGGYSLICFFNMIGSGVLVFLCFSLLFRMLCFCTNHCILFWCFYELGMLPLVYLIFKDSPYSERYLAGWYFCRYLLVTSLPLVLILIYLSVVQGRFLFREWTIDDTIRGFIYIVLSFVFFTKVPLVPFHTWLPIVHAEATSIVSIYLSGYIMKLGLLGVYRSCWTVFEDGVWFYLFICLLSCIYFFFAAINELDGKRWLAFLSLSHIIVPFLGFFACDRENIMFTFLFCLGHGLGAGIVFRLLWWLYESCKSRKWILVKSSVNKKMAIMLVVSFSLLTLCSFPITINFVCEVSLVKASSFSLLCAYFWAVYLFFGGLIPLVLCGHLLIRCEFVDNNYTGYYCWFAYLFYLCLWCYAGVLYF